MTTQDLPLQQDCRRWANRLLILSVLGIAYLTLFPFEIRFSSPHPFHGSPFFLGDSVKTLRHMDFFLNVLLFVPFGFGISAQVGKRGGLRRTAFLWSLFVGACTTYLVELLQLYIPGRDSGWEDTISNTAGSVVGFILFAILGGEILPAMSQAADFLNSWMSPRRVALLLALYFAVWAGPTWLLQRETRLSNWDPACQLVLGNDAVGGNPWNGQVAQVQIWSRALPEQAVQSLAGPASVNLPTDGLEAAYDFKSAAPFRDQREHLPPLEWSSARPGTSSDGAAQLGPASWLRTGTPTADLTREILKTNQFTVHMVITPAAIDGASGRILSLSQSPENINFHMRQDGKNLVLFLRDPLSEAHSMLAWMVRGVFEAGKARDIVAEYDGSYAYLYLDGARVPRVYRLNPGAAFFHHILPIKTADLGGFVLVFETLVFLPAGVLAGWNAKSWATRKFFAAALLAIGLLLPAIAFEALQMMASGRGIWPANIVMCVVFGLAGVLYMNADGNWCKAQQK